MSLVQHLFEHAAAGNAHARAWIEVSDRGTCEQLSWSQFAGASAALAQRLAHAGVGPGDHVAIVCDNGLPLVLAICALRIVGASAEVEQPRSAVDIVIDTRLTDSGIADIIDHCDAKFTLLAASHRDRGLGGASRVVCLTSLVDQISPAAIDADISGRLARFASRLNPDAPEAILYTSGTSGAPKGVVLSHGNLLSNARAKLAAVPQRGDDRRLTVLPLSHAYARTCDLGTWLLSGCTLSAATGWDGLMHHGPHVRPTLINSVPALARRMLKQVDHEGFGDLRLLGCGGAAMDKDCFNAFARRSVTVIQGYGLTEAGPVIASATPDDAMPGYVGCPVAGVEVRVDAAGQLICRSPGVMLHYYNDASASDQRIVDGWLHTGDLVARHQNGQLQIVGRCDDLIVLDNAHKVMPGPIESLVCQIDGIEHALLYLTPGAQLTLWVDDRSGRSPQLRQHAISQRLADVPRYAQPRRVLATRIELSQQNGTLSAKGTVRRGELIRRLTASDC